MNKVFPVHTPSILGPHYWVLVHSGYLKKGQNQLITVVSSGTRVQ
jgi:hypothetical protein